MPIKFDLNCYTETHPVFIETGTYKGEGVMKAIKSGFTKIYSIELDKTRFEYCQNRFKKYDHVHIIHGDSGIELPKLMEDIDERCLFWIDAHYCADGAELAEKWTPIKEELITIENHQIKNHTILIDDYRCMDNTHIDEKTQKDVGFPGKQGLLDQLHDINPDYKLDFLDGVIVGDVVRAFVE